MRSLVTQWSSAFSYDPPDDQFVHNTLAEAIASLDVKAEIWDGAPFFRWQ